MRKIRNMPKLNISREIDEQLEISSHYKGYLKKQKANIGKRDENLIIPKHNYDDFLGFQMK